MRRGGRELNLIKDTFIDMDVVMGLPLGTTRGVGHTTHQILNAPKEADFVWCTEDTYYARDLARLLGRADLDIRSPSWFRRAQRDGYQRGHPDSPIVVDHAFYHPKEPPQFIF